MPSTQEFRRRIKSVNNTKQITKAMEMIASIKMQKAVKTAAQARVYIQNAWNILAKLAHLTLPENHPLLMPQSTGRTAVILVTSDRGLCGSYNSEVIKKFINFKANQLTRLPASQLDIIAIGKKGAEYVKRYNMGNLVAEFKSFESNISPEEIVPISKMTTDEFLAGNYGRVVVIYSHFESSIKQTPVVRQILPIVADHIDHPELWDTSNVISTHSEPAAGRTEEGEKSHQIGTDSDFKFEPSADAVMDGILKQVLRIQIYGAVLEGNASMYSAQMVAMKNATDSASDLIDDLKLVYNTVRQGNITREIAEISGAAEAMK